MIGLLVVTHGRLATELLEAVGRIVGHTDGMRAVSIDWNDDVDTARSRIEESVRSLDKGDGVLVLTDMLGGTPANISHSLVERGRVDVITGVNLPMLIKFTNLRKRMELPEVARRIADQGRRSIVVASEVLERRAEPAQEEQG